MSYNYAAHDFKLRDPWLYEQEQHPGQPHLDRLRLKELIDRCMIQVSTNTKPTGGIPPKISKEKPEMGYNDYGRDADHRTDQQKIDDAVREAIAAPRRAAEIERRVAAVAALEPLKDAEAGTLITFTRKIGNKDPFAYAALKTGEDRWFVTGDGHRSNGEVQTFDGLLTWLTTGSVLAENVQRVTAYEPVAKASK